MKLVKKFFCPVNAWDCPCQPNEDYFIWEDENGKRYDAQELLEMGYHFVNGEPVLDPALSPTMKIVAEILKSPSIEMVEIKIRNPNWEE